MYDGSKVKTLTYNMEGLLKLSVDKYLEIIGKDTKLKKVSTPSLPEDTKESKYRAPAHGKNCVECPWCAHKFDPDVSVPLSSDASSGGTPQDESSPRGTLAPHAASVLMKLLYAARIARFDLLRTINSLARNVTKWTTADDAKLHHLMCYVNSTLSMKMIGWVGDDIKELSLALFADADFAGCAQSLRSTSGSHLNVQGKHTRFPLAGGSKRQGCVSHSTPEAEIVAADTALRTLGIPAISIWRIIANRYPQLLFHDDNQGMIGVVRSGRNPTMRHMERTHGISIASLHEHFNRDHFVLICEITAKMAADIHTKGFKNPMAWKRACMLINLLEPEDISSKELYDIVQPSTDVDTTTRQVFQSKTDDVPNFPYTETPVLPHDVYVKGMTSKMGYQHVPGSDPIFVLKAPVFYRARPPGVPLPDGLHRSTWILANGVWSQTEDHAAPPAQAERFDRWVERACFQWHSPNGKVMTPIAASSHWDGERPNRRAPWASDAAPNRFVPTQDPQLMFSTESLFSDKALHHQLRSLADLTVPCVRVINTLLRLVHGGSHGTGFRSDSSSFRSNSTTRYTSNKRSCACEQSDIDDEVEHEELKSRKQNKQMSKINDCWEWIDDTTIVRKHNTPRRSRFSPQECESCPCDVRLLSDQRKTKQVFKNQVMDIEDNWRMKGDYSKNVTNKRNEFWTGQTVFKVMKHNSIGMFKPHSSGKNHVTLCTGCRGMEIMSQEHVFVIHRVSAETWLMTEDYPQVQLTLLLKNGKEMVYRFNRSIEDQNLSVFGGLDINVTLVELPDEVPTLVLLCSEERNWFTQLTKNPRKHEFHVVTITEDDDLLSSYGYCKVKACLRSKLDTAFFSGPCAGGSPWNRLNKWMKQSTVHMLEAKQKLFWRLWKVFTDLLVHAIDIEAPALMELPRGCDYWRDKRMTDLVDGTENVEHAFDGCMYGLRSSYTKEPMPIKKPWKIISWNIHFPELHQTCDHSHEHVECAGRETKLTQTYTPCIVAHIVKGVNKHIIRERTLLESFHAESDLDKEHPNIRLRKAKDFSRRSRVSSSSGRRPVTCVVIYDNTAEKELLGLLRVLAGKCSLGGTLGPTHCVSLDPSGSILQAGAQLLDLADIRRGLCLTDNMGGVLNSMKAGCFSRSHSSNFVKALQDYDAERGPPPGLIQIIRSRRSPDGVVIVPALTYHQAETWVMNGAPPIVVAAAYFESSRWRSEEVSEFFKAMQLIGDRMSDADKEKTAASFISGCRTVITLFKDGGPKALERFCDEDIFGALMNVWDEIKVHFQPVPFKHDRKMEDVMDDIMRRLAVRGASRHVNTEPPFDSPLATTRTSAFRSFHLDTAKTLPRYIGADRVASCCRGMMLEGRFLAHALRSHNRAVQDPANHISIVAILMDIINFENGTTDERQTVLEKKLMLFRCAAQNHLTMMLSVNDFLIEVKKEMLSMSNFPDRGVALDMINKWRGMANDIETAQQQMVEAFRMQLPSDVVIGCGFNIAQAEEGFYKHVKKRRDTQSRMRDFATSLSDEQSGGSLNATQCEILTFGDNRQPAELIDHPHLYYPEWTEERQLAEKQAKDEEKRRQEEERNAKRAEEERRKASEHGSQSSSGPAPKPKAMPSRKPPTPKGKDWVRLTFAPMATVVPKEGVDYNGTPVQCEVLMNGNYFVAFTMEGVVAGAAMKHKVWQQYLRRITHYSSLVLGTVSNATLPELDNASDEEWLRLYTHNFNMTSMRRCHCFLSPESMMIRIDLCNIPETSRDIPALVKKLQSKFGTAIIEDPSAPDADQHLCGQIRAAPTVLITDMMYHTRSNQKRVNNLESGLQNAMGNPDLKVFPTSMGSHV